MNNKLSASLKGRALDVYEGCQMRMRPIMINWRILFLEGGGKHIKIRFGGGGERDGTVRLRPFPEYVTHIEPIVRSSKVGENWRTQGKTV